MKWCYLCARYTINCEKILTGDGHSIICCNTSHGYKRLLTAEQRAWFYNNGQGRTIYPELISATPNTTTTSNQVTFVYPATWTKYYAGHSAVRTCAPGGNGCSAPTYTLADHLQSSSLTLNASGSVLTEMRYSPWGNTRSVWKKPGDPTAVLPSYSYTGQYGYVDDPSTIGVEGFGLHYYKARWYDGYLNHFTQPDTIVPDPGNSQDWDRYSYARNNPIRYIDPNGHESKNPCDYYGGEECKPKPKPTPKPEVHFYVICGFGVVNACSTQSTNPMTPEQLRTDQYNGQYPLQPIMNWGNTQGQVHPYDVIFQKITKQEVADMVIQDIESHPGQINVLVTFSAGTVSGNKVYDAISNKIAAFVALGPQSGETNLSQNDKKLFVGINSQGTNSGSYHYYPGISHTNLSVNSTVMQDVINFLSGVLGQ